MLLANLPDNFWIGVFGSLLFGAIGIAMLLLGLFLFDLVTKKIDVQEQLNKGNMAVALVVAAMLLSIGYIVAHVVH